MDVMGEPIVGVNVMEKGTTNGTITDMDGKFLLKAPANATLIISFIGYKTLAVNLEGEKNVNVRLDYGFGKNGQSGFIFNINEAF